MIHLHRSTRTIKPCGYTLLRHFIDKTIHSWYGILTCFPSPTAFALSLGPTNPGRINLAQETLGFRRTGFSPVLSLLVPTFSLLLRPALLAVRLQPTHRTLPYRPYSSKTIQTRGFGDTLSPVTFSAQRPSTSELLRTL